MEVTLFYKGVEIKAGDVKAEWTDGRCRHVGSLTDYVMERECQAIERYAERENRGR